MFVYFIVQSLYPIGRGRLQCTFGLFFEILQCVGLACVRMRCECVSSLFYMELFSEYFFFLRAYLEMSALVYRVFGVPIMDGVYERVFSHERVRTLMSFMVLLVHHSLVSF